MPPQAFSIHWLRKRCGTSWMRRVRRFTAVCIMMTQSIRSMKQRYSGCFWQTVLPFRIISGSPGLSESVKRSFYLRLSSMKIFLSGRS